MMVFKENDDGMLRHVPFSFIFTISEHKSCGVANSWSGLYFLPVETRRLIPAFVIGFVDRGPVLH